MPKNKKVKQITIKEITDAFYKGVSPEKIKEMAERLVKQSRRSHTDHPRSVRMDK